MNKMLDELKKLNNIENNNNIPEDFSKRVIDKIKNTRKSSNVIKYVASTITLVAACFIVVTIVLNNGKLSNRKEKTSINESEISNKNEIIIFDAAYSNDNLKSESNILEENIYDATAESLKEAAASDQNTYNVEENGEYKKEYYNTILDLLKTNNIEAEQIEDGIKAKCTKSEAEEILFYYNEITITTEEDFVIIK